MNHVRAQVRKNMSAIIQAAIPDIHVFESKTTPLQKHNTPAFLVKTPGETIEPLTQGRNQGGRMQKRTIVTEVYVFGRADENIEDYIDTLAKQVEDAVAADYTLGNVAISTSLDSVIIDTSASPDTSNGAALLNFSSVVHTAEGQSEISIRN